VLSDGVLHKAVTSHFNRPLTAGGGDGTNSPMRFEVAQSSFLIGFFVFKENTFASATIEIGTGQKVISSGPYALVRHPMHVGWLVTFSGVPPALGSWWGLFTLIPILLVIVWRLLDEEIFLAGNLPGYSEYQNQVQYRLVPFIW